MNSKVYCGIKYLFYRVRSCILKAYYKFWGLNIGKGGTIYKKVLFCGYLNNINIGSNVVLDYFVKIIVNKEGCLKIGNNTLISSNVNINAGVGKITIGKNTMVAANSYIINNDHDVFDRLSVRNSGHITQDIEIGDNVWIGANCTILKGVKIGEGAIIGAGSVVTKDVKPYSINAGIPSKFIKTRFKKDELISKLISEGYNDEKVNELVKKASQDSL